MTKVSASIFGSSSYAIICSTVTQFPDTQLSCQENYHRIIQFLNSPSRGRAVSETNPHNQGTSVTRHQKLAGVLTRGQVLKVVTKLTLRDTSCTRKSKRTPVPSFFTKNRTKTCQRNRLKGISRATSQHDLRHRGTSVKRRQALPWKWVDLWAARMFIGGSNNFPQSAEQ